MQGIQERALPGTVVIQRHTLSRDSMGGFTESWAAVGTAIGRIYMRNSLLSREGTPGERITSNVRWFATFPVGTDVTAEDRLSLNGRTWEVTSVNNDQMWQTAVRCECNTMNEEVRS